MCIRDRDYGSDLDLIFVVDPGSPSEIAKEGARRRAETLIHLLTAITHEGSLYDVALRALKESWSRRAADCWTTSGAPLAPGRRWPFSRPGPSPATWTSDGSSSRSSKRLYSAPWTGARSPPRSAP